jgi:hypothetical protein
MPAQAFMVAKTWQPVAKKMVRVSEFQCSMSVYGGRSLQRLATKYLNDEPNSGGIGIGFMTMAPQEGREGHLSGVGFSRAVQIRPSTSNTIKITMMRPRPPDGP